MENIQNIFFVKLNFWQFQTFSQFKNWFLPILEIAKKNHFGKKNFREIDLFDFTSVFFFFLDFFKFSGPLCAVHLMWKCKNIISTQLNTFLRNIVFAYWKPSTYDQFNTLLALKYQQDLITDSSRGELLIITLTLIRYLQPIIIHIQCALISKELELAFLLFTL